jgi:predicted regulator of Ras-like GTPase activity (Roadblock/LC7/MglB family)
MSFDEILRQIVEQCPGCAGAALMGADGISIAERSGARDAEEVSLLGVEFGRVLEEARKVAAAVNGGELQELVVDLARVSLALRAIDPETYFVLAVEPSGNLAKGRYLLRRYSLEVREQL